MFYHFLNQLFEITMELDNNINGLSTYTVGVQYHVWRWHKIRIRLYKKGVVKTNG